MDRENRVESGNGRCLANLILNYARKALTEEVTTRPGADLLESIA